MKHFFLFLSKRRILQNLLSTSGPFKIVSRRFISGEILEEGLNVSRELNRQGISATLDYLGESVQNEKDVFEVIREYLKIINCLISMPKGKTFSELHNFNITVSLKLTQLGLAPKPANPAGLSFGRKSGPVISDAFCLNNIRQVAQEAKRHQKLITIDMEDSPYTDRTLQIYQTLLKEGFSNTGIVIQSYLRRSENDLKNLLPLGPRVRLCKGAYQEPAHLAFPAKKDVDLNYLKLLEILFSPEALARGSYPEIATHDEKIINWVINFVKDRRILSEQFEFQMLYGIRRDLQQKLVRQGYRMRVYLPYGTHWYPYFMRRLAERPANVLFLLKSLFQR